MPEASTVASDPRTLLKTGMTPADYHRAARAIRGADALPGMTPLRVAVLSSFAAEFLEPFLVVEGMRVGLQLKAYLGAAHPQARRKFPCSRMRVAIHC